MSLGRGGGFGGCVDGGGTISTMTTTTSTSRSRGISSSRRFGSVELGSQGILHYVKVSVIRRNSVNFYMINSQKLKFCVKKNFVT
jgi:hypothetical protein